jgi:hypothetical protein
VSAVDGYRYAVYKAGIVKMPQLPVVHGRGAGASSRLHIIRVRSDESVDERVRQGGHARRGG